MSAPHPFLNDFGVPAATQNSIKIRPRETQNSLLDHNSLILVRFVRLGAFRTGPEAILKAPEDVPEHISIGFCNTSIPPDVAQLRGSTLLFQASCWHQAVLLNIMQRRYFYFPVAIPRSV